MDDGMVGLGVGGAKGLKRSATVVDKSFSSRAIGGGGGADGEQNPAVAPGVQTVPASANGTPAAKVIATHGSLSKGGNHSPKRPPLTSAPQTGSSIRPPGTSGNAGTEAKSTIPTDRAPRPFGTLGHGSSAQGIYGGGRGSGTVIGGGLGRKASKKTSLPSVIASPVRGGKGLDGGAMDEDDEGEYSEQADVNMQSAADVSVVMNDVDDESTGKTLEIGVDVTVEDYGGMVCASIGLPMLTCWPLMCLMNESAFNVHRYNARNTTSMVW